MAKLTDLDKQWRAESDLRTLTDAQKIKADKTRMAAVKAEAQRVTKAVSAVVKKPTPTRRRTGK